MRYDDIEVHKSLVDENIELVELVAETRKELKKESRYIFNQFGILITKFEKLAENSRNPFNWRSLKIMASFISIGLFFGALSVGGYAYYAIHKAEESAYAINTKIINNLVHSFALPKTKKEMGEYSYTEVGDGQNPLLIKINGVQFKTQDIVNGWRFEKAQDMFKKAFFTNVENPESVFVANLKKVQ